MSTDLERELRDLLSADAGSAPPPHEGRPAVRRTRRRQFAAATSAVVGLAAIVVAVVAGLRLMDRSPDAAPALEPTRIATMNGVGIEIPETWRLIDPDEAGFNGPDDPTVEFPPFPRMILALAPFDPGELFGCPGLATDPHTFLMTLQEEPLALTGPGAATWPVELETLDVGADESACYPGWEFLRAGWTASGRTFEARLGLAPEATATDREAVFAAFESLTFEPAERPVERVVIGTGEAGGEAWALTASNGSDGLELSLEMESSGLGVGVLDPAQWTLGFVESLIGDGTGAERLAFAAIPVEVATFEIESDDGSFDAYRLDVPDDLDGRFDVLAIEFPPDASGLVRLLDAGGELIASAPIGGPDGSSDGGSDGVDPAEPADPPASTPIEHGGTYWGLYLAVTADAEDPTLAEWSEHANSAGYATGAGGLACDDGAADELGVPADWTGVAVYFSTRQDAEAAYEWFATNDREPHGIARVTTYCLD